MNSNGSKKDSSIAYLSTKRYMACHECDFLHCVMPVPNGAKALCTRCGAVLYQHIPNTIDRSLALNLTAFMLLILTQVFPIMSMKLSGRLEESHFLSGVVALYRLGMGEVGILVLLTSVLFPFMTIAGMLYILVPMKFGHRPWKTGQVFAMVKTLTPWSLTSVFMLGVVIAFVKLLDIAVIIPGISLYAFLGFVVVLTAAHANLDANAIWPHMPLDPPYRKPGATALEQGLISCHTCALLVPGIGPGNCPRCNTPLHSRKTNSLARTWSLILAASLLFIPANIYPVMTVIQLGRTSPNTILTGVVQLIESGMWILALIIFFASIIVPVLKLIVLSFLLITVKKGSTWRSRDRTLLFRVTEVIGAWSMVDIYVVAILTGLVKFGNLSSILPGSGVVFFGAVVVITLFAARSFDPRLIWDNMEPLK